MPMKIVSQTWCAVILPAVLGFGVAWLAVNVFKEYGYVLFWGLPLLVPTLSAFLSCYRQPRSWGSAFFLAAFSVLLLGLLMLCVAFEGALCLAMALPFAVLLCLPGVVLGRGLAELFSKPGDAGKVVSVLVLIFPLLMGLEAAGTGEPPERRVVTRVEIAAPPERVWEAVVAFPPITAPLPVLFRAGVAYPLEARIEGTGVGAVRYCTFSTGSFVEPITHWLPPELLAFDVTSSPEPLRELSPYGHLDAPHLHGYMVSHRGQFRILREGGKTVLEGTTWYSHALAPQRYWGAVSDEIIHAIHRRVLEHIRQVSERS